MYNHNIESLFRNSVLHDYKMEKIEIDSSQEVIILQLLNSENEKINIAV